MKKIKKIIIILLIVILIFIISVKMDVILLNKGKIDGIYYSNIEKEEIEKDTITGGMAVSEKRWEDLEIFERFNEVQFKNSIYYNCNLNHINGIYVGEFIKKKELKSLDYSNSQKYHTEEVNIYSVNNLKNDVAILVEFNGNGNYYTYINSAFSYSTLNELNEAFHIKELIKIDSVNYIKEDDNKTITMKLESFPISKLEESLVSKKEIKLENFSSNLTNKYFEISTDSSLFGNCVKLYLMENGDFIIDIASIRKKVYINIGPERFEEILELVGQTNDAKIKITYYK